MKNTQPADRASDLLCQLISQNTVNPMDRPYSGEPIERPVIAIIQQLFSLHDVRMARQSCGKFHENLLVEVRGKHDGPATLFESHADTVPADDWIGSAFRPRVENGRVLGRGACDDKGPLVAMVLALLEVLESGERPAQDTLLLVAGDEEFGQTGIKQFVSSHDGIIGRGVFGEPTLCSPILQHKGVVRWDITVHGRSCHSSTPENGRDAIRDMMQVIDHLRELQNDLARRHDNPMLTSPTLTVTRIDGGRTRNSLADMCTCALDFRISPGMDCIDAARAVQRSIDQLEIELEHSDFQCATPALNTKSDDPFAIEVLRSCSAELGHELSFGAATYGTDAAWMPGDGPAIVLGPGDIAHAHAIDEYIDLNEMMTCVNIYKRIMLHNWLA